MMRAILAVRGVAGFLWLFLLVLGVLFWTGHALTWVPVHRVVGVLFTLALLALAILTARAGAPPALVAITAVWALLIPWLGFTQVELLPGRYHWVVRVLHLVVGMVAMALAGRLVVTVSPRRQSPPKSPAAGVPPLPHAGR